LLYCIERASESTFAPSLGYWTHQFSLFDLPIASLPGPRHSTTHIPPLPSIEAIELSLRIFRDRLPPVFDYRDNTHYNPGSISPHDTSIPEPYDGLNDPWFVLLHCNLFTAEMMMWKEMAHHRVGSYEQAVGCARALVMFIRRMRPENWVHVGQSCPGCVANVELMSRYDGCSRYIPMFPIPLQGE
jgi:hypothetical protein